MYKFCLMLLIFIFTLGLATSVEKTPAVKPITKINPKDGAEMVLIPAGEFLMGSAQTEKTVVMRRNRS